MNIGAAAEFLHVYTVKVLLLFKSNLCVLFQQKVFCVVCSECCMNVDVQNHTTQAHPHIHTPETSNLEKMLHSILFPKMSEYQKKMPHNM
jgi:hypothetical protein